MLTKTKSLFVCLIILASIFGIITVFSNFNKDSKVVSQKDNFPKQIEVAIGQSGTSLEKQYGPLVNANKRNFGLNFYTIDADNHGQSVEAAIKTGGITTIIPNAMSISATEDRDRSVGFTNIDIGAEINRDEFVSHPIAHQYVMNLVRNLRKTGWRYNFYDSAPRLKGQAAFDYYKQENIDPDYPLTFEQWMALPYTFNWMLYADHTYLELSVTRDINHLDPAKPGAYFISLTFQPREEVERLEVDEKDRDNWRATWVERYRKYRAERNLAEAKLRAKGIPIDTHYQEPPLPPPPAGQHNPTIPDDLK